MELNTEYALRYANPPMTNWKRAVIMLASLVVGTLILFIAGERQPRYLLPYAMICLVGIIICWNLGAALNRSIAWYSPHIFILLFLFLIEVGAPITTIALDFESAVYNRPLLPGEMAAASGVSLIAILAYLIGWKLGPKRQTLSPGLERMIRDTPQTGVYVSVFAFATFLVSILAWAYMYAAGGGIAAHVTDMGGGRRDLIQEASGLVWHLARFGYAAVFLYFAARGPRSLLAWLMFFTLAALLFSFGSRSYLAILLAGMLIVYRFRFTNKTPKTLLLISAGVLFMVATFLSLLRQTEGSIGAAMDIYQYQISDLRGTAELVFGHLTFIINRAELMNHLADTGDYQYGKTYLNLLQIIPERIWPAQREMLPPPGNMYYLQTFFPERIGKVSLSNNLITEMYLNFWYPGVIVGCMFFGICVRFLHAKLVAPDWRRMHIFPAVITALLAVSWFRLIKSGSGVLISFFYLLFPVLVFYFFKSLFSSAPPPNQSGQQR